MVGDRLCIYNGLALPSLNHTRTIHPDQVLRLNPDPALLWVPYYQPAEAEADFQQIPYQEAIEDMGRAVDAGDVDTMRGIWNDVGDLNVLSQMFS